MKAAPRYEGPVIISIAGSWDDQQVPLTRQRRRLETILGDLGADEWRTPSRCDGWTVQDVVAHLTGVNAFWHASVSAGLAGTPTRILSGFDPVATPLLMVEGMRALSAAEVFEQFVASNDALLATTAELDEAAWSVLAESPPGHVPIRLLAFHALWDSWIHERDIAIPLGSTPVVEPDEVLSSLRYAAALSSACALTFGGPCQGVFAVATDDLECSFAVEVDASVNVRDGSAPVGVPCLRGGAVDLVEALSLRAPLPAATPSEWRALLSGLATFFDAPS